MTYQSNFTATLPDADGEHAVLVALRGRTTAFPPAWDETLLTLDRVPPLLVITNPAAALNSRPLIQVQGYSPEPLLSLRFDLTNSVTGIADGQGFVTAQHVDTNTLQLTTNWFQCFDLELSPGSNRLTLRAADLAGNSTTNDYDLIFDVTADTVAPLVRLHWPQNGARISGTNFTLRAWLDDPTASIVATVSSASGTNSVIGMAERNGRVWVDNLPLAPGSNQVVLTATDAATNVSTTNIVVMSSSVALVIDELPESALNNATIQVTGTISSSEHAVWVNGVRATVEDGSWTADNVPLNDGGTAVVQARAIPQDDHEGNGTGGQGGGSASYEDPGNPESQEAIDAEAQAEQLPEIRSVAYQAAVSWRTQDGAGNSADALEGWNWGVGRAGWHTHASCWHGADNYEQYVVDRYQWGANGEGTNRVYLSTECGLETPFTGFPYTAPESFAGEFARVKSHRTVPGTYSALPEGQTVQRAVRTLFVLHTGGKACARAQSLFRIHTEVTAISNVFYPELDADPQAAPAVPEQVVVLGQALDSEGNVYALAMDGETLQTTPQSLRHKRIAFAQTPNKFRLEIYRGGLPITGKTNRAIVGEQISLSCGLRAIDGGQPPEITNWLWTIQGTTFSNYVADANTGRVFSAFIRTNAEVEYYWMDGGIKSVSCLAALSRVVIWGAHTRFDVVKPTGDFYLTVRGTIGADTNYIGLLGEWVLAPVLHFGNRVPGTEGIVFTFTNANLQGYPLSGYQFFFVQVGRTEGRQCNPLETRCRWSTNGLDTAYPYLQKVFLNQLHGEASDNPVMPLHADASEAYRGDVFDVYLMFEPMPGIEVPLKKATWSWQGSAVNTNGSWTLTNVVYPTNFTGISAASFPEWTFNIANTPWTTNASSCTCP